MRRFDIKTNLAVILMGGLCLGVSQNGWAQPETAAPVDSSPYQPKIDTPVDPPASPTPPPSKPTPPPASSTPPPAKPTPPPASSTPPPVPTPDPPAPPACAEDPDEPVRRGHADDMGLIFRFGGLGTMFAVGNGRDTSPDPSDATNVFFSQVGFKSVFSEAWMMPIYVGLGYRQVDSGGSGDTPSDFGIDFGIGFEHHFRIWRRISPFVGVNLALSFTSPDDRDLTLFGFGLQPVLGVEYYVFDRVSLQAVYMFGLNFQSISDGSLDAETIQLVTQAGGALNLTFYF